MQEEAKAFIREVREQVLYLKELGVDSLAVDWKPAENRAVSKAVPSATVSPISAIVKESPPPDIAIPARKPEAAKSDQRPAGSRMAALPSLANRKPADRSESVQPTSEDRSLTPPASEEKMNEITRSAAIIDPEKPKIAETIEAIRAEIGNCTRCPLHAQGRTQIVHSTGNFNAELMFVGEAPGADEDIKGEPFVGRAGQLLTKIIEAIGLKRDEVFIGNINRCRPPGNRQPLPEEASVCRPYLLREIEVIKPKVIVVLGAHAAHNLLEVKTPISKLRGHFHDYFGTKVMPTFHPAYLLRDPHKKKEVWEDMKMVRDLLRTL